MTSQIINFNYDISNQAKHVYWGHRILRQRKQKSLILLIGHRFEKHQCSSFPMILIFYYLIKKHVI